MFQCRRRAPVPPSFARVLVRHGSRASSLRSFFIQPLYMKRIHVLFLQLTPVFSLERIVEVNLPYAICLCNRRSPLYVRYVYSAHFTRKMLTCRAYSRIVSNRHVLVLHDPGFFHFFITFCFNTSQYTTASINSCCKCSSQPIIP